jgi:hypothetical protein
MFPNGRSLPAGALRRPAEPATPAHAATPALPATAGAIRRLGALSPFASVALPASALPAAPSAPGSMGPPAPRLPSRPRLAGEARRVARPAPLAASIAPRGSGLSARATLSPRLAWDRPDASVQRPPAGLARFAGASLRSGSERPDAAAIAQARATTASALAPALRSDGRVSPRATVATQPVGDWLSVSHDGKQVCKKAFDLDLQAPPAGLAGELLFLAGHSAFVHPMGVNAVMILRSPSATAVAYTEDLDNLARILERHRSTFYQHTKTLARCTIAYCHAGRAALVRSNFEDFMADETTAAPRSGGLRAPHDVVETVQRIKRKQDTHNLNKASFSASLIEVPGQCPALLVSPAGQRTFVTGPTIDKAIDL